MPLNNLNIAGTDGIVPVYDPNRRWTIWSMDEIFFGNVGANKYVPNVKDYVMEPDTFITHIVEFLDPVTLLPTLREIRPANLSYSLNQTDLLFGVGPGTPADTYRIYLDNSVTPHLLAIDTRLKISGTLSNHAKIFRGADVSSSGDVISKMYDNSGNFISENVPLELVAIDSHNNYSIKIVAVCNTSVDMVDGELVTVVIYNDQGNVVSKRQLVVENTAFIRDINVSQKYVTHINLESAFLSPVNNNEIDFPLNIPMNGLNMMGVVNYSDGSTLRLPVDGNKFNMYGLDQYVSSIVGQQIDLVLSYTLATNEVAIGAVVGDGKFITENYVLKTVNPNYSYAVKLFCYPYWVGPGIGYGLKWFLFNLDRNVWFDVTSTVRFSDATGPFDPLLYGFIQRKTVSINLADVTGMFNDFIHVQNVTIVLNDEPQLDIQFDAWNVSTEAPVPELPYGDGIYALRSATNYINLAMGETVFDDWLSKVYLRTYPIIDTRNETAPITPTHFVVMSRGQELTFPITDWDSDLLVNNVLDDFENVYVRFIKIVGTEQLELSVAGIMVK